MNIIRVKYHTCNVSCAPLETKSSGDDVAKLPLHFLHLIFTLGVVGSCRVVVLALELSFIAEAGPGLFSRHCKTRENEIESHIETIHIILCQQNETTPLYFSSFTCHRFFIMSNRKISSNCSTRQYFK